MAQPQLTSDSLQESIRILKTQRRFHRDKVPGFNEAIEGIKCLPLDEGFLRTLLEKFQEFQGCHIVQISKIISRIEALCSTNFKLEVEKMWNTVCETHSIAMDISLLLNIVLDTLSSEKATEKTLNTIDVVVKELDHLFSTSTEVGGIPFDQTSYTRRQYHLWDNLFEWHRVLKRFYDEDKGQILIRWTSSLIALDKSRVALRNGTDDWATTKAWHKLLKMPWVNTNLAILVAEAERDQYNAHVEQHQDFEHNYANTYSAIVPQVVSAFEKLTKHADSQQEKQERDVICQMIHVSGSFDKDSSRRVEPNDSRSEVGRKWEVLFRATAQWDRFPVELTKLVLDCRCTAVDFELLVKFSAVCSGPRQLVLFDEHDRSPLDEAFIHVSNRTLDERRSRDSTIAVLDFLLNTSRVNTDNKTEHILSVIDYLRRIDDLTEKEGEVADWKASCYLKIFFDLQNLWQARPDFMKQVSAELQECCSENVPPEELEGMVSAFIAATGRNVEHYALFWRILVSIYRNQNLRNKPKIWHRYSHRFSAMANCQASDAFLLPAGAIGLLSAENGQLLLDELSSDPLRARLLSLQVLSCKRICNGDLDRHYSLVFSALERKAVTPQLFEHLKVMNDILCGTPTMVSSISEDTYNALVVAVTESATRCDYSVTVERFTFMSVAHQLTIMPDPPDVTSLYQTEKSRRERAWNSCRTHHGGNVLLINSCIAVEVSELWMAVFTKCTTLLRSSYGSIKAQIVSVAEEKVLQEGIMDPEELCNALMHFIIPVNADESTKDSSLAMELVEKLVNIPGILRFLAKIPSKRSTWIWKSLTDPILELQVFSDVVPVDNRTLVSLVLDRCRNERGKALEICHFLSTLGNKSTLLLKVGMAAIENQEEQDLSEELEVLSRIWMVERAPLSMIADLLVASYRYGVCQRETFVAEVLQIQGVDREMHSLLQTSGLYGKAWQKFGTVQGTGQKLRDVLSHLDQSQLSKSLTSAEPVQLEQLVQRIWEELHEVSSPRGTAAKHKDLFCDSFHWLLLETDLPPADIARCIKLTLPCFDCCCNVLQGRSTLSGLFASMGDQAQSTPEEDSSPIKVAFMILKALRTKQDEEEMEQDLLKRLPEVMCETGWLHTCSVRRDVSTGKKLVDDLLELLKASGAMQEVLLWLENPKLLHCGNAVSVMLATCKWQRHDHDWEIRVDVGCKVKLLLEAMTQERFSCCTQSHPFDSLSKLLRLDLKHALTVKLLDVFLRDESMALMCGTIIRNWQSTQEEGVKLLEMFSSLATRQRDTCFESDLLMLDTPSGFESAENIFQMWTQLGAQRRLGRHYPLHNAVRWCQNVSEPAFSPSIKQSWLSIFRIAECKVRDVDVVTSLTPDVIRVLSPDSTCIQDCLFSTETVSKILLSCLKVDEEKLKITLVLARLLSEFAALAQRVHEDKSADGQEIMKSLQDGTCELCKTFQKKLHNSTQDGRNDESEGRASSEAITPCSVLVQESAMPATSNVPRLSTDERSVNRDVPFPLDGAFSNVATKRYSRGRSTVKVGQDITGIPKPSMRVSAKELYRISRLCQQEVFTQMAKNWGFNVRHLLTGNKTMREGLLMLMRRWLATFGQYGNHKLPVTRGHVNEIFKLVSRANGEESPAAQADHEATNSRSVATADRTSHQAGHCCSAEETRESLLGLMTSRIGQENLSEESGATLQPEAVMGASAPPGTIALASDSTGDQSSSSAESCSLTGCGAAIPGIMKDSCSIQRSLENQKSAATVSTHSPTGGNHQSGHHTSPQTDVRDYILSLKGNQALIARLQKAGYNQCDTLNDPSPVSLWYDSTIRLTGSIGARRNDREHQATRQLRKHCNEYVDLLRQEDVQTVQIDDNCMRVGNLFAASLTWDELIKQSDVVKDELQNMPRQADRELRYQVLVRREREMRADLAAVYFSAVSRSNMTLRYASCALYVSQWSWLMKCSRRRSPPTQKSSTWRSWCNYEITCVSWFSRIVFEEHRLLSTVILVLQNKPRELPRESTKREVFAIMWENRFFEAIKLCSENIPGLFRLFSYSYRTGFSAWAGLVHHDRQFQLTLFNYASSHLLLQTNICYLNQNPGPDNLDSCGTYKSEIFVCFLPVSWTLLCFHRPRVLRSTRCSRTQASAVRPVCRQQNHQCFPRNPREAS